MKLSAILLGAISVAVLSSCEKSDVKPDEQQDAPQVPDGPQSSDPCLACGMG